VGRALNISKNQVAGVGACASLFFGSFGDEAAQVSFALHLADGSAASPAEVSALLSAGLAGGIIAGPVGSRLLSAIGARRMITVIVIAEALLIAAASTMNELWWYLTISAALGCLGSALWSAVLVAIPALALAESGIDRANRMVQSVRNCGYVVGPLLGSALFAVSHGTRGLLGLAVLMLAAALGALVSLRSLVAPTVGREGSPDGPKGVDVVGLLRTPGVLRALLPLIVTVLVTSALNVLLIVRIRSELSLSATAYGVVVASLSIGLVLGPILFAKTVGRIGARAGASLAAAVIGAAIVALGAVSAPWQLIVAAVIVGIANGVQNALMAGFIMKAVDAGHRARRMPAYVLILQSTVFSGFIAAGFIHISAAGAALIAVGVIAVVAGSAGVAVNRNVNPHSKEATL